jgi:hypothetical protein
VNSISQARFGGGDDEADWVTVRQCATVEEAHVLKGALEAEGIPAVIANQALTNIIGATSFHGIRVKVPASLEDRAVKLLEG